MSNSFQTLASTIQNDGGAMTTATLALIKAMANNSTVNAFGTAPTVTLTALSGGGQTGAVALGLGLNQVSTSAAAGNSVLLPPSAVGAIVIVENAGAFPIQVFGTSTDTVNSQTDTVGVNQSVGQTALYYCVVLGNWIQVMLPNQNLTLVAISASGAVYPHASQSYVVTKAGVAALTLAAPTATVDDGTEITITSSTANAHTLTATGLLQTGTASVNEVTFAAHAGASVTLQAYQGDWQVVAYNNVTFS